MFRRAPTPLLAAAGFVAALLVEGILTLALPAGRTVDAQILGGFVGLESSSHPAQTAAWIAHHATPAVYAAIGAVLAAVALARRRPRLAVGVPAAMGAAIATTELLKVLLAHPRHWHSLWAANLVGPASWPSGHATAAMMLALCAVLVSPSAWRQLVALLGAGLAITVSYAILILPWHFPSDVLGGYLVAGAWVSLLLAAVSWSVRVRPPRREIVEEPASVATIVAPTVLAAVVVCVLVIREAIGRVHAPLGTAVVVGAIVIATLAALLPSGLAMALRASARAARTPPSSGEIPGAPAVDG
jgi:membrane-associated phospholipid phosphatase